MNKYRKTFGFTLIELIAVIVILAILTAVALPKFVNLSSSAKISILETIAGSMQSTIKLVRAKAFAQGLSPASSNPDDQSKFLIDFGHGVAEIDWRNLCPESSAELGDQLDMIDFINMEGEGLTSRENNQFTLVGYDYPSDYSNPTDQGCYIIYDSFGEPACTVTLVTEDC